MNGPKLNCGSANGRTLQSIATVTRRTAAENNCTWWWFNRVLNWRRTTRVRLWNENCGPLGARGIILLLCPVRRNRIIEVVRWWLPGVRVAWHHKNIIYSPHHIIGHHQMDNWRLCVFVGHHNYNGPTITPPPHMDSK